MTGMRDTRWLLLLPLLSCAPKTIFTDAQIPTLPKLDDVMWSQAQALDPQFRKIRKTAYTYEDYRSFLVAAGRLKLTTVRLKESFSKGPAWNGFADSLATHAGELADAAAAKDPTKSAAALIATKATCKYLFSGRT